MPERLTEIRLRRDAGLADWGRKTVPEMIIQYRQFAERQKASAEAILSASDDDFRVETYLGPNAQRQREILQEGAALTHRKEKQS